MYQSTKVIDGFSTCFRQWRAAESHCSKLHGYALKFKLVFESETLDSNNWVMDFGFLKKSTFKFDGFQIAEWFKKVFDHTVVIARDDPEFRAFQILEELGVAEIRVMDRVGCEAFAELVYNVIDLMLSHEGKSEVKLVSVECIEHEKNSALFIKK